MVKFLRMGLTERKVGGKVWRFRLTETPTSFLHTSAYVGRLGPVGVTTSATVVPMTTTTTMTKGSIPF